MKLRHSELIKIIDFLEKVCPQGTGIEPQVNILHQLEGTLRLTHQPEGGIGYTLTASVDLVVNGVHGTFSTEITGVENW